MRKITRLRSGNKNRLYYIFGIVAICAFVSIGIGYSILSSTVRVDGTASITSTWRVVFTKAIENTMQGATTTAGPSITGGTTLDIGVELNEKGSQAIYDVTVENQGTIDSYVKEIRLNDGEPTDLKVYISGIYKGFSLKAGESKQFQVIAEWSASAPESSETEKDVNVSIDFEQETDDVVKPELSMPTYTVDYPNEVWTKEKNVTMTYPEGEDLLYQYSTDGGKTWLIAPSRVYVLKYTQDGTLYIRVSDGISILTTPLITIEKIDNIVPSIEIDGNSSTWAGSKTLIIHASDQESGLASNPYSWDEGKTWTSIKEKEFTSNQTVNIWVKDAMGNIAKTEVVIDKIDMKAPRVLIGGNTVNPEPSKTIFLNAYDNESGLHETAYSWDGGNTWTSSSSKTFTANQQVEVWIRDKAGNITKRTIQISGITAEELELTVNYSNVTSSSATISAYITPTGTSVRNYKFSWNGNSQTKTSNTFVLTGLTKNTYYQVTVTATTSSGEQITETISFYTNNIPTPTYSSITNADGSKTVTVRYSGTKTSNLVYQYSIDNGYSWRTISGNEVQYTFTQSGTIIARVQDTGNNNNTVTAYTYTVTIEEEEELSLSIGYSSVTSAGATLKATVNPTGTSIKNYQFKINNTTYGTQSSSTFVATGLTKNTMQRVTVTATTSTGKQVTGSTTFWTNNIPVPTYSSQTNSDGSKTVTIRYSGTKTDNLEYQYSIDGGYSWRTVYGSSVMYTFYSSGTIIARVQDTENSGNTVTAYTYTVTVSGGSTSTPTTTPDPTPSGCGAIILASYVDFTSSGLSCSKMSAPKVSLVLNASRGVSEVVTIKAKLPGTSYFQTAQSDAVIHSGTTYNLDISTLFSNVIACRDGEIQEIEFLVERENNCSNITKTYYFGYNGDAVIYTADRNDFN